jgi:hypothetical protein
MDPFWESNHKRPDFIWKSTGLYAEAGKIVEIEVKQEIFNLVKVIWTDIGSDLLKIRLQNQIK